MSTTLGYGYHSRRVLIHSVENTVQDSRKSAGNLYNHVSYMKPSDTGSYLWRPFIQDRQLPVGLWPILYPRVSRVPPAMGGNSKHM